MNLNSPEAKILDQVWWEIVNSENPTSERIDAKEHIEAIIGKITRDQNKTAISLSEKVPRKFNDDLLYVYEDDFRLFESQIPIDERSYTTKRNKIKNGLKGGIDKSKMDQYKQRSGEQINVNRVYSEVIEALAKEGNRSVDSNIDYEQLLDDAKELRDVLVDREKIRFYRSFLAGYIEGFIRKKISLNRNELELIVESLIGELLFEGWEVQEIKALLRRFSTGHSHITKRIRDFCNRTYTDGEEIKYLIPTPEFPKELQGYTIGNVEIIHQSNGLISLNNFSKEILATTSSLGEFENECEMFVKVSAQAPSNRLRCQRAREKVERIVDVLNFGNQNSSIDTPFNNRETNFYSIQNGEINYSYLTKNSRYKRPAGSRINTDYIQYINDVFEEYLLEEEKTELGRSIVSSLRWYRYALLSNHPEERIVKYIISLECLFAPEGGDKSSDAISRAVKVAPTLREYEDELRERINKAYEIRNSVVHDGILYVDLPKSTETADNLGNSISSIISEIMIEKESEDTVLELIGNIKSERIKKSQKIISSSPFDIDSTFLCSATITDTYGKKLGTSWMEVKIVKEGNLAYHIGDVLQFEPANGLEITLPSRYTLKINKENKEYETDPAVVHRGDITNLRQGTPNELKLRWTRINEV